MAGLERGYTGTGSGYWCPRTASGAMFSHTTTQKGIYMYNDTYVDKEDVILIQLVG